MAEFYRLSRRLRQSEDVVDKLLNIYKSDLSQSAKNEELQKITSSKESSLLSLQKKQVSILEELWDRYREPDLSRENAASLLEKHKAFIDNARNLRLNEAFLTTGVKNATIGNIAQYSNNARAIADLGGGCSKALDVNTGEYSLTVRFSGEVDYKKFKSTIIRSPVTKKPEVFVSIKNILRKCEDKGMDRKQCARVLYQFVEEEFPENISSINLQAEKAREIASSTFNLVRSYKSLEAIQRALMAFKREPGVSVYVVYNKLKCLISELVKTRKPFNSDKECLVEVEQYLKKTIKDFLSPQAALLLDNFINQSHQHGESVNGEDILDFVMEIENSGPEYMVTQERSLTQKSLNLVSFNNNLLKQDIHELERNSRKDSWQSRFTNKEKGKGNSSERIPTPRGSSGGKSMSPSPSTGKVTEKEKKKEKVEKRSTSRGSGGRNRSRSGSQLNAKHCPICCLPSCENRGKQVGSCPELPQVRYNPANYCQTCYMIGHFSCGDQCKEVSKKRANMMLGN